MPTQSTVIVDALAARFGGTAVAAVEVANRLAHDERLDRVVVIAREGSLAVQGVRPSESVELLPLPAAGRAELLSRVAWEAMRLPQLVSERNATGVLTWSGMLPRTVDARVVSYLANALAFEGRGIGNRARRWALGRTARRAASVLVPSPAMAELVARELGPGTEAEVVPWGVDHDRLIPATRPGEELLCVADFYRHKRHRLLIEAWRLLGSPRPTLRLVGDARLDPEWYEELRRIASDLVAEGEVVVQDRIPHEELITAYRRARVLVLPTLHESFCLPLVEAQACGVPVVTTDLRVLRETGGNGAAYVASDSPAAWAEAMTPLLSEGGAHADLRAAAVANASRFDWDATATAVCDRFLD